MVALLRSAVKDGHGVFRLERLALDLIDQHAHSAFRAGFFVEHVLADALGEDALGLWIGYFFAAQKLEHGRSHGWHGLGHASGAVGSFNDGHFLAVQINARAFTVHAADHRQAQLLVDGRADNAAGRAVTAGIKGRPGDDAVRAKALHGFHHLGGLIAKGSLEGRAGAHDAFAHFGGYVGLFFTADTGKKLIDIVY